MRRSIRQSSSMAGLPALTQEQEEIQVQELILQKSQPQVTKCDLDAPHFETKGGHFPRRVVVELRPDPCADIRYTVERVDASAETSETSINAKHPSCRSPLYRKPFVLDEIGVYIVRAVAFKESGLMQQRSLTSVERFAVLPGAAGTLLRHLPSQMVQGVISIASGADRVASGLGNLKATIAEASNVLKSAIHLKIGDGKKNGKTEVGFSIEVQSGRSAQQMVDRLVDPSLVASVAKALDLDAACVVVEAEANALDDVLLSLSWTFPRRRLSGQGDREVDYLDGSCLIYAEDRLLEVVDYRGPQSIHGERVSSASGWSAGSGDRAAIVHSGDVMSDYGGKHALRLRLSMLPASVTDCIFTLSAYNSRDLSKFVAPSMRIFDETCPEHLLSVYSVADAGTSSAVVVCTLTREGASWSVRAHNRLAEATVRDYAPMEAVVSTVQERYARRRRRWPFICLQRLWREDRVLPCATTTAEKVEDVMLPLFDLNFDLFQHVIEFV